MKKIFAIGLVFGTMIFIILLISAQSVHFPGNVYAWPEDGRNCAECHSVLKPSVKSLKFGKTKLGTPVTQEIRISNFGADNLIVYTSDITFTGSSFNEFDQTNNCDVSIPYLSTCIISVTATPADYGKRLAGLVIPSNYVKANETTIPLSADAKPPKIKAKPSAVSFSFKRGETPPRKSLIITNNGLSDLIISSTFTPTGTDANDFLVTPDTCPTLPQGQSCTFEITYDPPGAKSSNAQIVIQSNDQVKPSVTVKLKGKSK